MFPENLLMGDKYSAPGAIFTAPNNPTRFGINVLYGRHVYQYFGNFSSSVPKFSTKNATVKFDNLGQFSGHLQVSGRLGTEGISLVLSRGPTLEGVLDNPLSSSTVVSGSGYWGEI
jgi:hypothetical protein